MTTYVYERNEKGEIVFNEKKGSTVKYTIRDVEGDGRQVFDHFGMTRREMLADTVNLTKGMDGNSYFNFHNKLYGNRREKK